MSLTVWSAGHTAVIGETVNIYRILEEKRVIKDVAKIRARET
jgi:hypothetical protein